MVFNFPLILSMLCEIAMMQSLTSRFQKIANQTSNITFFENAKIKACIFITLSVSSKEAEDPVKRQQERLRDWQRHHRNSTRNTHPRESPDSEQRDERRRERNTEAHRITRLDPERRQEEQYRNTEAHRIARLDPERRQEEQGRNTEAHRRVRLENPERRRQEQDQNTEAHRRLRLEDTERRQEEQERDTIGTYSKLSMVLHSNIIYGDTDNIAHRVARENPVRRLEEQQRDLLHRREARSNPEYQIQEQQMNNMQRQQVRGSRQASFRALHYQPDNFYNITDVGTLSIQCTNCGALKFHKEIESLCCSKGNVQLDEFPQVQPFLQHLYDGTDSNGKHFLANIRKYNCAFQMTSFGCNEVSMSGFNPSLEYRVRSTTLLAALLPQKVSLLNLLKSISSMIRSQK